MERKSTQDSLVVIPCFNEEDTIGSLVLKTKHYINTVVVVDDGSHDHTVQIARDAGAIVLSHQHNQGKSAAIKTGFAYALNKGFNEVITLDGDGQHNPEEIPTILTEMHRNGHDIVVGIRVGAMTEMPFWRKIGKRVLDYATSFGAGGYLTDSQSGFRGFNKNAIEHLLPHLNGDAFSTESEQLITAHDLGLNIGATRVSCKYNDLETSTKSPTTHGLSVLWSVIRMVAQRRPLLFIIPGLIFVFLGTLLGLYFFQIYIESLIIFSTIQLLTSTFIIVGLLGILIGLKENILPPTPKRNKNKTSK